MSGIILNQTIIMLLLMLVGIFCSKAKIISSSANRELSKFVLQVVNPIMIFMSYQTEIHDNLVKNLLITFAMSVVAFAVMILAVYLIIPKKEGRETEIERFSSIYSNCAFMGMPLANAMFGNEGVFYLTAFITVFNLVVWTHGIIMLTGERDMKKVIKVFYSPTVISIVLGLITFFLQIKLPALPTKVFEYISGLNTPMAMIVSGVSMAETDILKMIKKLSVYRVCLVKLIILPVILSVILSFIPIDEKVRLTVLVAASAPPAAMCTLQCLNNGKNYHYASEIFTAGTIFSIVTLPAVVKLTEYLTKIIS
ncbi:MAG: AEC family transporter [Lachnospiraceae bacterium]|nr:AEC family transporter [Lachnospiraceae bacterium]MCM1230359.1 AEC family transporter [Ruminococcus flavefaciens]